MGVAAGPNVVEDGLVLALDAGNPKNYNAGISTNWTDNVGGNNGTLVNGTHHNDGPFIGAGSVYFDGTGDYLSLASTTCYLGANDFTVEAWVYWAGNTALSSVPAIISKWSTTGGPFQFLVNASGFSFQYNKASGGSVGAVGTTAPIANRWYHIAAVKYGSELKLYVDGVAEATTTGATAILNRNDNVQIGHRTWGGPQPVAWDGYISNLRLTRTALYTSNFTPPRKKLEATSDTVLLTCEKGTIRDRSPSAHTITINGNAKSISGASYFELDGTNDYIDLGDTFDDIISGADKKFTIESWVNPDSVSGNKTIVSKYGDSNFSENTRQFQLRIDGDEVKTYVWFGQSGDRRDYATSSANLTAGSWHHIVLVYDGSIDAAGRFTFYVNGQNEAATETYTNGSWGDMQDTAARFAIGAVVGENVANSPLSPFDGKISNTKIYSRLLTAAEVEQNYNATKGRYGL